MGQEIVYCFKCQKRILGTEITKGLAYQVENQMCCSTCVVLVLDTLPPKAKEQLLAKMYQANEARQSTSSTAMKSLPGAPSKSSTGRIPIIASRAARAEGDGSSSTLFMGMGGAVLALVAAAVVLSWGSSPPVPPTPARTVKPPPLAPPPPPPPDPGPSPEEKRRADAARDAMKKARDFAAANSRDLEGQAKQWRAALADAERTGFESEARRELEKAEARVKEALGQEMTELDRQVRAPLTRKDFKAAQEILDQARSRRSAADWVALLSRLQTEIQDAAARAFVELKDKALVARDRGAKADVDAIKASVAKWGLPHYVAELETALEVAWRPIFDGKTTAFVGSACKEHWTVVDGALTHVPGTELQAGQSKEEFGDGEIRFRFTVERSEHMFIAVRQGSGAVRAPFNKPALDAMGPGEHEILFTCRGTNVSATLDGKPLKLETYGPQALPKGKLQFNSATGVIRFTAIDYRP